jgi:hypothetical protein
LGLAVPHRQNTTRRRASVWLLASAMLATVISTSAFAVERAPSSRCADAGRAVGRKWCRPEPRGRTAKVRGITALLRGRIENVDHAAAYLFDAHDNSGHGLDGLKAAPFGGVFLGVYHSNVDGTFYEHLGYSYDLLHWHFLCDLDANASQAAITRLPDNSWMVAYEHTVPSDHGWINLRFRWYANDRAMLSCIPTRQYDAPRTLDETAEGTPNFYRVDWHGSIARCSVLIGLHYLNDALHVDREASATLMDFISFSARRIPRYDTLFDDLGYAGNHGDRDAFTFEGRSYVIWEAQRKPFAFGTWRTFLYSAATRRVYELAMQTPGHSEAFGNPSVSSVTVADHPYLFVTQFVFGEAAARGEAGELLYLVDAT